MRLVIFAIILLLLHIIGIEWYKTLAAFCVVVVFWNLPSIWKQTLTRKWRW